MRMPFERYPSGLAAFEVNKATLRISREKAHVGAIANEQTTLAAHHPSLGRRRFQADVRSLGGGTGHDRGEYFANSVSENECGCDLAHRSFDFPRCVLSFCAPCCNCS